MREVIMQYSGEGEDIVEKANRWTERINAGQDPDARRKMMEEAYHGEAE